MTTIEKKSVRAGKFVDTKHVDTLVSNYKQKRWAKNSDELGKDDSLSVWYSIEELEDFLQQAKQSGADGVRMHFGVYPENFDKKPEVSNMQTIVMVANSTFETVTGRIEKNIYVNGQNGKQLLAYNYGGLWPSQGLDPNDTGIGITIVDRGDKGLAVI